MKGLLPVREMEVYDNYLKHLNKQIQKQKEIIAIRQRVFDERQQAMIAAYKEQRQVELLHNKIACQEARQACQFEQKNMDYDFILRKSER
jgi:flagellar export protein FliJ